MHGCHIFLNKKYLELKIIKKLKLEIEIKLGWMDNHTTPRSFPDNWEVGVVHLDAQYLVYFEWRQPPQLITPLLSN